MANFKDIAHANFMRFYLISQQVRFLFGTRPEYCCHVLIQFQITLIFLWRRTICFFFFLASWYRVYLYYYMYSIMDLTFI